MRANLRDLWTSHRGPILFASGLLALITVLFLLPPVAEPAPSLPPLPHFEVEPRIRILLLSLRAGERIAVGPARYLGPDDGESTSRGRTRLLAKGGGILAAGDEILPLPCTLAPAVEGFVRFGDLSYKGTITLSGDGERILAINEVGLETYLEGVIEPEMGWRFHEEALKAQVVASRSYAAHHLLARAHRAYHVSDDQGSQVYRGLPLRPDRARRIVQETRGIVLAHEGRPLEALFSSSCGGATRPAGEAFGGATLPPLAGAVCGYCDAAPGARWSVRTSADQVGRTVGLDGPVTAVGREWRLESGRLDRIQLLGAARSRSVTAAALRRLFGAGARSTWFTRVTIEGGELCAEGRGFGHGVGLCQYGAEGLAARGGAGWKEILARYFPGSTFALLYPLET